MKRLFAAALAAAGLALPFGGLAQDAAPQSTPLPVSDIRFPDGFKVAAELALTPETQERGLMYRTEMTEDHGMLFVFPKEAWVQFWMKNTWMDLDMVFIGADKKITKIYNRVPRSYPGWADDKVAKVPGYGLYVLELSRGVAKKHKLKTGEKLDFALPKT
jgi:uncharacterized membrane protein (UPF0127 family)